MSTLKVPATSTTAVDVTSSVLIGSGAAVFFSLGVIGLLLGWVLDGDPYYPPEWVRQNSVLLIHILCMGLSLVCVTWAILAWNIPFIQEHLHRKLIHFLLNASGLVALGIGLAATIDWDGHRSPGKHFYSLHSWIGIIVIGLFVLQALGGIGVFLLQLVSPSERAAALPMHKFGGITIYTLLILAGLTGMQNRETMLIFTGAVDLLDEFGYIANFLSLCVILMAVSVYYVLWNKLSIYSAVPVITTTTYDVPVGGLTASNPDTGLVKTPLGYDAGTGPTAVTAANTPANSTL